MTSPLQKKKGRFVIEENAGTGLLFAALFKNKPANYALLASNQYAAQRLYEFLLNFLGEKDVVFFPNDELLRAEALASSRELLSQRLYALWRLQDNSPKILITHPSGVLRYLPNPKRFAEETIAIKKGDLFDLKALKSRLVDLGYQGQNKVERSLQFASRGDILDIFSVSYLNPVRIEFFGDEVDSIRTFDPQTQKSLDTLDEAVILPATDIFLNDDELSSFAQRLKERIEKDKATVGPSVGQLIQERALDDLDQFIQHNYKGELYRYYGFALDKVYNVLNYFHPEFVFIPNHPQFTASATLIEQEANNYLMELFYKGKTVSRLQQYIPAEQCLVGQSVMLGEPFQSKPGSTTFLVNRIVSPGKTLSLALQTIQSYLATNEKVVLALPEPKQQEAVISYLEEQGIEYEKTKGYEIPNGKLGITDAALNEGFEISLLHLAFLSSSELFGRKNVTSRFTGRFKEATVLRSYEDLKPGDYVVHEYNGIGQFIDVQTIETDGVHRDYLHILYAGDEALYVPLEQFRLVRKYAGREGAAPKLSHLFGGEWDKRKAKIKQRVSDLADRLIALYGERTKIEGFAFPPDDEIQEQFEAEFPHPLTEDQEKALQEIKADMEKPEIMDRLLCGDVGFGKTEVAFRAAFKAINSGKQVALLCPTTLLARQHFEVARERFEGFGVRIALFSRLISDAEFNQYCDEISAGKIHLAIGTHRLLSKKVAFKDLGLLIVDEEQRFGVEQKEMIKELKKNVDVLTLSATPIPRTLQMSLVGIRPLSEINTAPSSRMPIQTYVVPYQTELIDELIQRELSRDGQVFYVYNKVATIYAVASKLAARIPGANIGVVHGQMDKQSIEETMEKFYDNELNVLVCTSIVENGIDIPNANMIIVEDADHFGLSQLYQIKGRVGRGSRIAYAYLLYRAHKNLNPDAEQRLKAISEFTELGSGYKIAQRDLMIRGAGDILGPEQAGFIDSIGLDLYLKLLNEAIEAKKEGHEAPKPPVAKRMLTIDAYIPAGYASKSDKIQLYQELDDVSSEEELALFQRKLRDIYGRIPDEVELLVRKKKIDLIMEYEEFDSLEEKEKTVDVILSEKLSRISGIGTELFDALSMYLGAMRSGFIKRKVYFSIFKKDDWLTRLEAILRTVHKVYAKHCEE